VRVYDISACTRICINHAIASFASHSLSRGRIVPLRAQSYLASLLKDAQNLPRVQDQASQKASKAAETVATFFAAKHAKNVPQCFEGKFTFLNKTHDFGAPDRIDWCIDMDNGRYQLWRANLAFMGYLCTACDADPKRGLELAAQLATSMRAISTFDDRRRFSDVWNSYPVAQRILALSALMIRLPQELHQSPDRIVVEDFLRFNVAYLLRNLETELGYNHLERNLSALALYALATGQMPDGIAQVLHEHFPHIVGETIGDDGVQLERSPMYQGYVVQSMRVLVQLDLWSVSQKALLDARCGQVEAALAAMTLGDDRPSMMNDGWLDETPVTSTILGTYSPPGFVAMRNAGYARLAQGDAVILFDAGPIGADANPGHGHSDFLSFELSLGQDRFIVDPGTFMYSPGEERDRARSWNAHNGPAIEGVEPVEYLGSFKVGRRVSAQLGDAFENEAGQHASGSLRFGSVAVERSLLLAGNSVLVTDRWLEGAGHRRSSFLVPADWQATIRSADEILFVKGAQKVLCRVAKGGISLSDTQYSVRYNVSEAAHALVAHPEGDVLSLSLSWGED
jgi:hypothetical protein